MKLHGMFSVQSVLAFMSVIFVFLAPGNPSRALADETVLYLHSDGGGCVTNATTFFLDTTSPTGTQAKCKDSPGINRTEFKEIATWSAVPESQARQITALSDVHAWIGLKNSDDIGTYFDLRAELLKNGVMIAEGVTQNIQGVVRNANQAKEVTVAFGTISDNQLQAGDVLSVKILTKVTDQGGHSSAVGLRLYYDSTARTSRFGVTLGPLDTTLPTITAAASPAPNAVGWNTTEVIVTFTCSDAESGIASCPGPITVTTEGANQVISGTATDNAGNSATESVTLNIDKSAPAIVLQSPENLAATNQTLLVEGAVKDVSPITQVSVNGSPATLSGGAFARTITLTPGANLVTVTATDTVANTATVSRSVTLVTATPPDPSTVAPSLSRTTATSLASATEFLYSSPTPVQFGVVPGAIKLQRAAVLRGRVLDQIGQPIAGVTITVLYHPEYGLTLTRADGMFDLAVNGGGPLTVNYQKTGFPSLQRQINVPWQDYALLPDVILVPYDPQASYIDFTPACDPNMNCTPQPMQVARGTLVTDEAGSRQATLLFVPGTTVTMTLPGNTSAFLTSFHIRATEYTVGPNGPKAMPADLPPTSGYTYEAEYSIDEAEAAGATAVFFAPAAISYTENFLSFPVGEVVPSGKYDRKRGMWIPAQNGLVVKILSVTNGLADLDLNGTGQPADAAALLALGVSTEEREKLALLYASGQSLWRVPIDHFLSIIQN